MKHIQSALLCSAFFFASATPLMAFDFEDGGIYYEIISKSKKTCAVTASSKARNDYSGEVKIPASATFKGENYAVVAIDAHAFDNCSEMTMLTLSPNIRKINKAFANCTALQMVIMEGTTPPEKKKEVFATVPVYVPDVAVGSYQSTAEWFGTKIASSTFHLHYILNDETLIYKEVLVNSPIPRPEEPAKRGYTFSGWSGEPKGFIMPPHDVTIKGELTVNSYGVTYMLEDEQYDKKSFNFGTLMVHPMPRVYDAYDFSGWEDAPADQSMPDRDLTLHGHYTLNIMKAVSRLRLDYNEVREYRVIRPFVGKSAPSEKASTIGQYGYELPCYEEGATLFHHPDGYNEEMVRYNEDWYKWNQEFEGDPTEAFIPADAVQLTKSLQSTLFPISLLERGPLTFAHDARHRIRVIKPNFNGHYFADLYSGQQQEYGDDIIVVEEYGPDYNNNLVYSYHIIDEYGLNEAKTAYNLSTMMTTMSTSTPLFDEAGNMVRNGNAEDGIAECFAFLVPAENALYNYIYNMDEMNKTLCKYTLVQKK